MWVKCKKQRIVDLVLEGMANARTVPRRSRPEVFIVFGWRLARLHLTQLATKVETRTVISLVLVQNQMPSCNALNFQEGNKRKENNNGEKIVLGHM
ncbi:hypothetical protein V6N13_112295 [Hibiscus sabdariffa]|uniref:Uncharacterized protein n=1 Tax=Hibiscus sabdariffa TaxID=183260 RepID=A0ABR2TNJ1_9ROSI